MTAILFSLVTFFSTSLGGVFALRYRSRLRLIMGLTAGVLVGLVIFDLLPEIYRLIAVQHINVTGPMLAMMVGYLTFYIIEKTTLMHFTEEDAIDRTARAMLPEGIVAEETLAEPVGVTHGHGSPAVQTHPRIGLLSALALSGHSFLDGVGIGLGFQVSTAAGVAVAIAVIAHDFSDGLNTVTLMLFNRNTTRRAVILLLTDALAPLLGTISTFFFTISGVALPLYLGFFAGFLLYIGASDILPAAHSEKSTSWTVGLTVVGAAFALVVARLLV